MLAALLFDLDGTLADTDPIHMRAWHNALADHDLEIDEDFYRAKVSGRLNPNIVAELLPELDAERADALIERKEARFRELADRLEPLAGLGKGGATRRAHFARSAVRRCAPAGPRALATCRRRALARPRPGP